MRIGIVCPYSFEVPGGVQGHVRDLAEALIALGHSVSVLAPADEDAPLPPYVVPAGRAVPVRYNGSVARLTFGPVSAARVRRWLSAGEFDVLHVHEPFTPSLSLLAVASAKDEPIVATFHTAMTRSRAMQAASVVLQLVLERITARIAVSELARKVHVEHLSGGALGDPQRGVGGPVRARRAAARLAGRGWRDRLPGAVHRAAQGLPDAAGRVRRAGPGPARAAAAGGRPRRPGGAAGGRAAGGRGPDHVPRHGLRRRDKARMLRSVDVYVAPNTGGESFGMILTEAMAAGTAVAASDIEAFRRVLDGAGALFPVGDAPALAGVLGELLDHPTRRAELADRGRLVVAAYDWPTVARRVLEVYHLAIEATPRPGPVAPAGPLTRHRPRAGSRSSQPVHKIVRLRCVHHVGGRQRSWPSSC